MYISEIVTTPPENISERVPLEQEVYKVFKKLGIAYERVDNDPASSMEECADIGKVFQAPVRKDVFLCNQKKTTFFLLVMPEEKRLTQHPSVRSLECLICLLRFRNICGSISEQSRVLQVL